MTISFDSGPLARALRDGRNPDGGWGYYPGKASRLEPTCWALLALQDISPAVLESWPHQEGLLVERSGGSVNVGFHSVAMIALAVRGARHAAGNDHLAAALERAHGVALPPSQNNRQDNSLQGWSWIAETFSWVEPTAWGLLALRRTQASRQPDPARLRDAEALLVDRCCLTGGWNYGNSNMLGKELRPYVPTTAVALLALQGRSQAAVARSVDYLDRTATSERSSLALALALVALRAWNRPVTAVTEALEEQVSTTLALGNQMGMALTLFALSGSSNEALRV